MTDWERIRAHYATLLAAKRLAGLTQQDVATAGGLGAQNAISKLLSNQNLGPSVTTFVRAVRGLGLTVSEFFAPLESREAADGAAPAPTIPPAERSLLDRIADLERAILRAAPASTPTVPGDAMPPGPLGRSSDGSTHTGVVNNISTISTRDLIDLRAEVAKTASVIVDEFRRLETSLVENLRGDRAPRAKTSRARKHPRRRARKLAR